MLAEDKRAVGHRGHVLVVDDDRMVRAVFTDILEWMGYDVDTAASGREALSLLRRGDYQLVITDLVMPGMSGLEVAHAVRGQPRAVPVILISGSIDLLDVRSVDTRGLRLLSKPVHLHELEEAVQQALSGRPRSW